MDAVFTTYGMLSRLEWLWERRWGLAVLDEAQAIKNPSAQQRRATKRLQAGGTGLNLTAASHVIHFDRWWNPAVENQATDRAFRIGQRRNVMVHKFVCQGTVEERIDAMLRDKSDLAEQVLSEGVPKLITEMGDKELLDLVRLDLDAIEEE